MKYIPNGLISENQKFLMLNTGIIYIPRTIKIQTKRFYQKLKLPKQQRQAKIPYTR